jgi:hypothetical protein
MNHPFVGIKNRKELPDYIKKSGFKKICEIGIRRGGNFHNMLKANPEFAVAIDIWKEDGVLSRNDACFSQEALDELYESFCESVKDRNVKVIRDYSFEAVKQFDDNYFDFVYIDGDHSYEGTKRDIIDWYPKVRKGGILSGHDFGNPGNKRMKFGVTKAVKEFVNNRKLSGKFFVGKEANPSWFIVRT